jgi:hypothetical protein
VVCVISLCDSASSSARANRTCSGTRDDGPATLIDDTRATPVGGSIIGESDPELLDGDVERIIVADVEIDNGELVTDAAADADDDNEL